MLPVTYATALPHSILEIFTPQDVPSGVEVGVFVSVGVGVVVIAGVGVGVGQTIPKASAILPKQLTQFDSPAKLISETYCSVNVEAVTKVVQPVNPCVSIKYVNPRVNPVVIEPTFIILPGTQQSSKKPTVGGNGDDVTVGVTVGVIVGVTVFVGVNVTVLNVITLDVDE